MTKDVEVRKEGDQWSVYADGKLLQAGLSREELALKVAAAVREVLDPYAGPDPYYRPLPRDQNSHHR